MSYEPVPTDEEENRDWMENERELSLLGPVSENLLANARSLGIDTEGKTRRELILAIRRQVRADLAFDYERGRSRDEGE
jgi:hypothetical protein